MIMSECILAVANESVGYPTQWKTSTFSGKRIRLHVFTLEQKLGRELKPNHECCHTCDIRNCINPEHLFEGTRTENINDAWVKGRRKGNWGSYVNAAKTHCPKGHEYTQRRDGTGRYCRECNKLRMRESNARTKTHP